MWSSSRDSWQRLVEAVVKREKYLELAHKPYSRNTSISTSDSDYSEESLSNSLESTTASPSQPLHQFQRRTVSQVRKNASGPITWKLFSALQRTSKPKDNCLDGLPEDLQLHLTRLRRFSLHELQLATDNFHNRNILGGSRHGKLYKGCLADGLLVAVKRLTAQLQEIRTQLEVTTVAGHCNVLRLCGFCLTEEECLLIFPYMANGSVMSCLIDRPEQQASLDWRTRKEIAMGTARGLAYLHDECVNSIIHRNITAANILLDEDFRAVIANFGSIIITDRENTDVLKDAVRGTRGHIALEKSDVYSYGIFLLQLITGQRAFDLGQLAQDEDVMLVDWVKRYCLEKQWKIIADPNC